MNTKKITIFNEDTGEELTGSVDFLANQLKITRPTMYKFIEHGRWGDWNISEPAPDTDRSVKSEEPQPEEKEVSTVKQPTKPLSTKERSVKLPQNQDKYRQAQLLHLKPIHQESREKTIIPSGKCVIKGCGRTTYHTQTIDGELVFICFNKCQDINPKPDPIPPDPTKLAYLQDYIKKNTPQGKVKTGDKIPII